MEQIIIEFSPDGTSQVSVNGVPGERCRELTAGLEAAIGAVTEVEPTPEMYEARGQLRPEAAR